MADLLFPPSCAACRAPVLGRSSFCSACDAGLKAIVGAICLRCGIPILGAGEDRVCQRCLLQPPHFERARACLRYDGDRGPTPLRDCLHRLKYGRTLAYCRPLAEVVTRFAPLAVDGYDLAVPVPLHLERLRWRGFNQALLLLRPLAAGAGLPVDPRALVRRVTTRPQVSLTAAERQRNVRNAFVVPDPARVRGRRILLFDDVATTGATVDECARTLCRAGASAVDVLVLGRAVRR